MKKTLTLNSKPLRYNGSILCVFEFEEDGMFWFGLGFSSFLICESEDLAIIEKIFKKIVDVSEAW